MDGLQTLVRTGQGLQAQRLWSILKGLRLCGARTMVEVEGLQSTAHSLTQQSRATDYDLGKQ